MLSLESIKKAQRADGLASILAIGWANPENIMEQSTCDKLAIRKRHFFWHEEFLTTNPRFSTLMDNSLNIRQEVVIRVMLKLGTEAATKAIKEWGQPKSRITHLIFCPISGMDLLGADYKLTKILGLNPNSERVMLYQQGCFAGTTTLRLAKCLAESRKGARVLIVCVETTTVLYRASSEEHEDDIVTQALFVVGATALIVGADPDEEAQERASFVIVSTSQVLLPDSEGAIRGHVSEGGLSTTLHRDVPRIVSKNVRKCWEEAFTALGISNWSSIFWVPYPGGRTILNQAEERMGLKPEKLWDSMHVLTKYINMSSVYVHFALDEISKKSAKEGKSTTGEGLNWGVLFGFGPGLTLETVVLHSVPL